ncbi:MAG: hypothetical protein ACMUIP_09350 [bacterium]
MYSKHIIADSCSLLLLVKCNVLNALTEHTNVVIPEAVMKETTGKEATVKYPDASLIAQYISEERIKIVFVNKQNDEFNKNLLASLGAGEQEILLLSRQMKKSIVATDDGKAIKICRYFGIHFIISPKIVTELYRLNKIDDKKAKMAIQKLRIIGRYSPDIIAEAFYQLEEIKHAQTDNR